MKLRAMKSLQPDPAPFTPIVRDILFKFKFTKIDEEKIFLVIHKLFNLLFSK